MGENGNNHRADGVATGAAGVRHAHGVRVRALVLLSGGVRKTELAAGLERSLLDLPLPGGKTILGAWLEHAQQLGSACSVRVLVSQGLALPERAPGGALADVTIAHDKGEFRGTGGVLRDAAEEFDDDDWLLVAAGNQVLQRSLGSLVADLTSLESPVALLSESDGTSVGVELVQCRALREIRPKGYIDLKEQALPQIAAQFGVRVARSTTRAAYAIRTLDQYVRAVRTLSQSDRCTLDEDVFAEEWSPTFSLVQEGARVAQGAMVHDAIVMQGATVEAGAVLVRSLVCPGASVLRGAMVADTVVSAKSVVRGTGRGAA